MTYEEAQAELYVLRGLAEGNDLTPIKHRIERLYNAVCGKPLRRCKCKHILEDALLEIYARLVNTPKDKYMAKARLVNGVVLLHKGSHYTNANLTDEVAREFLALYPQRVDWFSVLPEKEPENGTEITPTGEKSQDKATTLAKKKTSKKGK